MASAISDYDAMHRARTEEERRPEQKQLGGAQLALQQPDPALVPVQAHDQAHGHNAAEGAPEGAASSEHEQAAEARSGRMAASATRAVPQAIPHAADVLRVPAAQSVLDQCQASGDHLTPPAPPTLPPETQARCTRAQDALGGNERGQLRVNATGDSKDSKDSKDNLRSQVLQLALL